MYLETALMIKDGLADATNGLNAHIAALTLNGSHTRPANPNRYFDIEHNWVARREVNEDDTATVTFPALAVFEAEPTQILDQEPMTDVRDAEVRVALAHLVKKQPSAATVRDALYAQRALLRWFTWFMRNDQSGAFRTKNGIIIRTIPEGGLLQERVHEEMGAAVCVASTTATFIVRETSI